MTYAFRCRSCGALERAEQAGEREVPAACHICGAGVRFDPRTGARTYDPDNWAVLADEPKVALASYGLGPEDVERHVPAPSAPAGREPGPIDRSADESVTASDMPRRKPGPADEPTTDRP